VSHLARVGDLSTSASLPGLKHSSAVARLERLEHFFVRLADLEAAYRHRIRSLPVHSGDLEAAVLDLQGAVDRAAARFLEGEPALQAQVFRP